MALPTRVTRAGQSYENDSARDFDTMLSRLFGGREQQDGGFWAPYAVDVREDADHIYVEADLPGFKKEEVDITLENNTLTLFAEKRSEQRQGDQKKGDLLLHERRYSRFQRSFTLPPTVDEKSIEAKLNDGVLTVVLKKREETKPRKVTVN